MPGCLSAVPGGRARPAADAAPGGHLHPRVRRPLQDAPGRRLYNYTRLETLGDKAQNGNNDVHWTKVTVDPRSDEVFSFQQQVVPGNRVAVPAP